MKLLTGQTVAVTGASSGLGTALSFEAARLGANCILLARNIQKLEVLRNELATKYPQQQFFSYQVDVINNQWVQSVFRTIADEGLTIDILINNAGIITKKFLEDTPESEIHAVIDTNLKGTVFCTHAVLQRMKAAGRGKIVNIISTQGKLAKPKQSIYDASKFGVRGFSESLQKELVGTGVHVFAIYPGTMNTDLLNHCDCQADPNDCMDPTDVAKIVLFAVTQPEGVFMDDVVIRRNYEHEWEI